MATGNQAKTKIRDWQKTHAGWKGFFQGYATAEKDALDRSRDRVGYVVANIRAMVRAGKSETEMMNFLDRIEVGHAR